jgi:hypothetical protein
VLGEGGKGWFPIASERSAQVNDLASRNVSYRRQFHAKVGAYAAGLWSLALKARNLPQQALFTEPWLSNPAVGLASPERVLGSLGTAEGSPEPPFRRG